MHRRRHRAPLPPAFAVLCLLGAVGNAPVQTDETAGWPREIRVDIVTVVMYQPQPETFEGNVLKARAAVSEGDAARAHDFPGDDGQQRERKAIYFYSQAMVATCAGKRSDIFIGSIFQPGSQRVLAFRVVIAFNDLHIQQEKKSGLRLHIDEQRSDRVGSRRLVSKDMTLTRRVAEKFSKRRTDFLFKLDNHVLVQGKHRDAIAFGTSFSPEIGHDKSGAGKQQRCGAPELAR